MLTRALTRLPIPRSRRETAFAAVVLGLALGLAATALADVPSTGDVRAASVTEIRAAHVPGSSPIDDVLSLREAAERNPSANLGAAPTVVEEAPAPAPPPGPVVERTWEGHASWYGPGFAGRRTANGERFDPAELTAAHKTLPFGSRVRVTSLRSGKSVVVRINDRGPFIEGREIDLSQAAAEAIGIRRRGVGAVRLELLAS